MHDPTVLQPPRGAAGGTVVLLSICAILAAIGVALCFGVLNIVAAAEVGAEVTEDQWRGTMGLFGLQTLAFLGACTLTGIFFMVWQSGAVKFARAVAPDLNTTGPGWATWSFIVPVANLFIPVRATYTAYTSCHAREFEERTGQPAPATGGLVAMWWAGWILMLVLILSVAFGDVGEADPFVEGATVDAVRAFWYTLAGSYLVTVFTAITAIVMVVKLTKVQSRLAGMDIQDEPEALPPAIMRAALPGAPAGGQVEQEPPLIPAQTASPAPVSSGLPGMPPPSATPEEEVVRRAGLPKPEEDEAPRHYMPGIPPPPSQSEAA